MKGDLPDACLRLNSFLPVRTHYASPVAEISQTNYRRPMKVGKKVFGSLSEAIKGLRVSSRTIYMMLADGRAEYLSSFSPKSRKESEKPE